MIADLKPYPEYKESELPWLGRVPVHWETRRLRHACDMRVSNVDKQTKPNEIPVRLCNYVDVYKNERIRESIRFMAATASEDERVRFGLRKDDVLITKDSEAWNDIGVPALVEFEASDLVCGYHLAILRSRPSLRGAFLHRVLESHFIAAQFHVEANGVTRYGLSQGAIQGIAIPLPPTDEQAAIVRFLDWANGRLERAIRAKRKVIALLHEQKQAIIHRAVTRGLDPSVPLKPSSIPWLGDIPQHWEVRKLKKIKSRAKNSFVDGPFGSSLKSIHYVPNGYAYVVESGFITSGDFRLKEFKTITREHFNTIQRSCCSEGDIIIAKIGAGFGMAGILPNLSRPAVVSGNSLKLTVDDAIASNGFVHLTLLTARAGGALDLIVNATAQPALSLGTMNDLSLPVPPRHEQDEILQHVGDATKELVAAISRLEREIDLLREYRTCLVADVVTGKLDVREAAARLPDEAPLDKAEDAAEMGDEGEGADEEATP